MKRYRIWEKLFFVFKGIVKFFYAPYHFSSLSLSQDEYTVFVGNHAQIHGPLVVELYFPVPCSIWCNGEMMSVRTVPAYAYEDFWRSKPPATRWLFRLLSYLIAPLAAFIFRYADTIPVYRDFRIATTFRRSVHTLMEGKALVIFPESREEYNTIINLFQRHFVDLGRMVGRKEKKPLVFVPFYIAPDLRQVVFGEKVVFSQENPIIEERERVCTLLQERITSLALTLPDHRVVPYNNLPKNQYPFSFSAKEKK